MCLCAWEAKGMTTKLTEVGRALGVLGIGSLQSNELLAYVDLISISILLAPALHDGTVTPGWYLRQ